MAYVLASQLVASKTRITIVVYTEKKICFFKYELIDNILILNSVVMGQTIDG